MLFPHFSAPSPILKSDSIILSHCILFFSYLVLILICNYIFICVIIFKCLKQKFISEPRRRGMKRPLSQRASGARNLRSTQRKWPPFLSSCVLGVQTTWEPAPSFPDLLRAHIHDLPTQLPNGLSSISFALSAASFAWAPPPENRLVGQL